MGHIITHLVAVVPVGATVFENALGSAVSNEIRMKFGVIVPEVNMH